MLPIGIASRTGVAKEAPRFSFAPKLFSTKYEAEDPGRVLSTEMTDFQWSF